MPNPRRDTHLESEGAEFLVLGQLLVEGIHAFKAYTNFPGWDLIAFSPARKIEQRIQVKSRYATGSKSFPINNFDSDFVALVVLNRGRRNRPGDLPGSPDVYVVPTETVKALAQTSRDFTRFTLLSLPGRGEGYLNNWTPVRTALGLETMS